MEAVVQYNYEAREADELTLKKGDVIKNIKMSLGGWWEGTLRDKRGMFPDNFVKVVDASGAARDASSGAESPATSEKSEQVVLRNGASGRRFCRVLFSYEPCNNDELKLVTQESIEFLGEVEEGWWRGRLRGHVGVFPSNFVSAPTSQEEKETCKVLFPYEAVNEDELTLEEGEIITLISKDAPDKGWWKGEHKGRIGVFPDNFVELISGKSEEKGGPKVKRSEKAHARKNLDVKNARAETSVRKTASSSGLFSEKKLLMSSLKRLVGDGSVALGEELDEVERGEGTPLSHLTASRAKAPRRRLPSTQLLRHQITSVPSIEEKMTNGNAENVSKLQDEGDGVAGKAKAKPPWVEELKLNQMERRKNVDRAEPPQVPKERPTRFGTSGKLLNEDVNLHCNLSSLSGKSDFADNPEAKVKDKEKAEPGFVPYHVYNQLLEKVALLEENQAALQRTVNQLAQVVSLLPNQAADHKE